MTQEADTLDAYVSAGERRAFELGNRGPIRFESDGKLAKEISDAYWRCGFYVFEGALSAEEIEDLRSDMENAFERAPCTKDADVDDQGRPRSATTSRALPSASQSL